MSGIQQLLLGGSPAGYQISRSLRFNSADSAYLNRTPASAGNRRTWTWSGWTKIDASSAYRLFAARVDDNNRFIFAYAGSTQFNLQVSNVVSGTSTVWAATNALLRDPSAWYHFVVTFDSTQATATNRLKVYVNGVEQTFSTDNRSSITQNYDGYVNNSIAHYIGTATTAAGNFSNGYMTEVNFIDGQALTPSSFGQSDPNTGVWSPIKYTGTYGTNGFYLNFSDNSNTTAATLGKDYSGNGNNWTPNNFSVTAGAGNDSLVDTPTSYGTDTGVGGEVRGNYATLNPLAMTGTYSNGNLDFTTAAADSTLISTIAVSSGKWYCEITPTAITANCQIGIVAATARNGFAPTNTNQHPSIVYVANTGNKFINGTGTTYGATYTTNDVIGVALDLDNLTLQFYKNGVGQGSITGVTSGTYCFAVGDGDSVNTWSGVSNFGQRPFAYTAPSGFKALCTQNLPTPTIGATSTTQAGKYFNTVLWTGANTNAGNSVTGVGFSPDFVWAKIRSQGYANLLYDRLRGTGATAELSSNETSAEGGTTSSERGYLNSFDSDGFSSVVGSAGDNLYFNQTSQTYVAWNWKANGAGSTNTAGTITSTVSANTTAGFSIVTYTGTGANATVGHGLGVAPQMIIIKNRQAANSWVVYHVSIGNGNVLLLNSTNASTADSTAWNTTTPTSTVFSLGSGAAADTNQTSGGGQHVAYCFAPVAGYSAFGSYTGNGSTDGPFVYTGFRPRYVMIKLSSAAGGNWIIVDTARDTYNLTIYKLGANVSDAENGANVGNSTQNTLDILSNGFKLRATQTDTNGSNTYIYAAFAEVPQKFSLAR